MTRLETGCRQSEEVVGERERFEFEIREDLNKSSKHTSVFGGVHRNRNNFIYSLPIRSGLNCTLFIVAYHEGKYIIIIIIMLAICLTGAHQILLHTAVHKKTLHLAYGAMVKSLINCC